MTTVIQNLEEFKTKRLQAFIVKITNQYDSSREFGWIIRKRSPIALK